MQILTKNGPLTERLSEHLDRYGGIRPFPAAVTRLLSALRDEDASAQSFVPIFESDPSLSLQVMRLVNCPLFGLPKVQSIGHAVSMLGAKKLRTLALSAAGAKLFSGGANARMQRQFIWNHSVGCAVVARTIAEHTTGITQEDAFLGGIFHDVGKLLFYDVAPIEYCELTSSLTGSDLTQQENLLFGTDHQEVGLKVAHDWELPKAVKVAIGWHHKPNDASMHQDVARVVCYADAFSKSWNVGPAQAVAVPTCEMISEYALSTSTLEEIRTRSIEEYRATIQNWKLS